ncbi:ester cyclase [Paraburkholderia sp. DHOC27]|uniref:ester cyclase n=1 Tax=Paraburkholderia sp. DHOC27 TaxID=2303330 RepID=UPI000E3D81FA|nr:ester cyclase [Paraburkholderia sp. DHOC27]RFU48343.1 nuclear transport factor 2 family protein [Paraburkholderia sp. DHOC27]
MSTVLDEQATRELIGRFYEAFSRKSVELLREVVAADWEYIPEPPGAVPGPDQMIAAFKRIESALPDMSIKLLDVLIHGDRVAVRAEVSGTQSGRLLGIDPTAKPLHFAIHSFHQIRDGVVAKTWHIEDWLSVFKQIGAYPQSLPGD